MRRRRTASKKSVEIYGEEEPEGHGAGQAAQAVVRRRTMRSKRTASKEAARTVLNNDIEHS